MTLRLHHATHQAKIVKVRRIWGESVARKVSQDRYFRLGIQGPMIRFHFTVASVVGVALRNPHTEVYIQSFLCKGVDA